MNLEFKKLSKELNRIKLPLNIDECKKIVRMLAKTPEHYFKIFLPKTISGLKRNINVPELNDVVVDVFNKAIKQYKRKCKFNPLYRFIIRSKYMKNIQQFDKLSKRSHTLQKAFMVEYLESLGLKHAKSFEEFENWDNCYITDDDISCIESSRSSNAKNEDSIKFLKKFDNSCSKFFDKNQGKKSDFYIKANGRKIVIEQKLLSEDGGGQDKQFVEAFNVLKAANNNKKNFYAIAQIDGDFWLRWLDVAKKYSLDYVANPNEEILKTLKNGDKKMISFANVVELCQNRDNAYMVNQNQLTELLKKIMNS